jgi:CRP/FNR family transcriptional regulator
LSDGAAYHIDKADFLSAAKTNLQLMSEVAIGMSGHYDDLLSRVNATEQSSVRHKLIATLRYLAERFSANRRVDLYQLGLRLTHEDIAMLIGSTRETVSLELQKLRQAGCIDYSRTEFVIDLDACTANAVS